LLDPSPSLLDRGGTAIRPDAIESGGNVTTMGIDVGATTIAGGLVTGAGDVLEVLQAPGRRSKPCSKSSTTCS